MKTRQMKKLLILCLLIITIFGPTSCTLIKPGNVTVFSNDGNTSVSVPSGWNTNDTTIKKIFPAAVIAASDAADQEYLVVIGEPKSTLGAGSSLNSFFAQIKAGSVAAVADGVWGNTSSIKLGGLNGLSATATGIWRATKTDSTFFVTALENSNYYYVMIAFTSTSVLNANEATLHQIVDSLKVPATTVISGSWKPYTFPWSVVLALILMIVGIGLVILGRRLRRNVEVPHPGRSLRIAMLTVWGLVILFILGVFIYHHSGRTTLEAGRGLGPIFPITLACAAVAFIYVAYISRHDGFFTAVGRAFICAAAGPMIFEFPFDLIVMPQIKTTATLLAAEFVPLDIAVLLTLSLLLLSRRVSITKHSLYALGTMFIVFAVWAWFGFSYASNTIAYVCNVVSKILGFITIIFLFHRGSKQVTENQLGTETAS